MVKVSNFLTKQVALQDFYTVFVENTKTRNLCKNKTNNNNLIQINSFRFICGLVEH